MDEELKAKIVEHITKSPTNKEKSRQLKLPALSTYQVSFWRYCRLPPGY
jgi:hypothetical protein